MNFDKFYKELEIDNNASDDEIKKAYRKMAVKYHPDKNPDNKEECESKFKKISEAYQALSDKEKYMRENASNSQRSGQMSGFINPDELFKQFFNMNVGGINIVNSGNTQSVMRSSNVRIENGKKIETITEIVNGIHSQKTIITDIGSSPNIGFRINGGTNIHNIIFR